MQDEPEKDPGQRAVQSIEVGGRLLLALAAHHGPMNLKDLAAQAGLTPARAHPYLVSFGKLGLIEQDKATGRYALGPSALQVGLASLSQLDPVRVAGPVAEDLASSTGFAVALALWGNLGPTVVRMIEARQPLLVAMRSGTVMSILGTATGRAFAGALPEKRVVRASPGAVGDEPGQAIAFSAAELKVLRQARQDLSAHGLVRAEGRPIPGVNAFSAPAFDHEGQPAIVITTLGHQDHFPSDWNSSVADAVRAAAAQISRGLGWQGSPAGGLAASERD
ncbi:IclR family transcriptional regulator [Rhizobacter sp. Root1221]|uniref:IclR family transcriptional regulator n=1 Tax=Rhizobacter sp. Root1221 TaxID=1736433 RepID=UPI0006FB197A|nr:IclR family transcriptional regulator [Rhizobacter sp. Root1221]KQV81295.1 IclR family transcriptional regulator [Rhizobacter sp. Root1221]